MPGSIQHTAERTPSPAGLRSHPRPIYLQSTSAPEKSFLPEESCSAFAYLIQIALKCVLRTTPSTGPSTALELYTLARTGAAEFDETVQVGRSSIGSTFPNRAGPIYALR
jgi:hypothetical protein